MTATIRGAALHAVKSTALLIDRIVPPAPGAVILIYHRVGALADVELDMPTDQFDQQMRTLATTGRAATLDAALAALDADTAPARDPVVVTFDDGTADFADDALPVLVEHGIPALLYLASGFVESDNALPYGGRPLTWAALRDSLSTGLVTIGSHTHTHAVLDRLPEAKVEEELRRCRELVEDQLGVSPVHFAYPKGAANSPIADAVVRRSFESAATGEIKSNPYGHTDIYRLGRTPIQRSDTMRWFDAKVDGGMRLEGTLRRWLNRARYGTKAN